MQEYMNFLSSHSFITAALIVVFIILTIIELVRKKRSTEGLTPLQAIQMINHQQAVVLDTRSQDLYRKGHIIDSQQFSSSEIDVNLKKLEKYRSKPLIVVCNAGVDSPKIASTLTKRGFQAYALSGGMRAWLDAQMPVVKG